MNGLRWAALAAATMVFVGCPYNGAVPMGGPIARVDDRLIGEWVNPDVSWEAKNRLWFARYDADEYVLVGFGECPGVGGRAQVTDVGGHAFVSVSHNDGARYRVARVDVTDTGMVIRQIKDIFDSVTTSATLRAMVAARIDNPDIYESPVLMKRTSLPITVTGDSAAALVPRACPFEGNESMMQPERHPELEKLTGEWLYSFGPDTMALKVQHFNADELLVVIPPILDAGDTWARAFLSRIDGALFLTTIALDKERTMTVARVDWAGDTLVLRPLNSGVRATTAAQLRQVLTGHVTDPALYYWDPVRLTRRKDP